MYQIQSGEESQIADRVCAFLNDFSIKVDKSEDEENAKEADEELHEDGEETLQNARAQKIKRQNILLLEKAIILLINGFYILKNQLEQFTETDFCKKVFDRFTKLFIQSEQSIKLWEELKLKLISELKLAVLKCMNNLNRKSSTTNVILSKKFLTLIILTIYIKVQY